MLDKEGKNIDAVTVSTPDNIHAVAAMRAITMSKHVATATPVRNVASEPKTAQNTPPVNGSVTAAT